MESEFIQPLVDAVRKFTSLKDFSKPGEQNFAEHMEYRAGLYRDMCEALRKYDEYKKKLNA
jgi:hypothetical protein